MVGNPWRLTDLGEMEEIDETEAEAAAAAAAADLEARRLGVGVGGLEASIVVKALADAWTWTDGEDDAQSAADDGIVVDDQREIPSPCANGLVIGEPGPSSLSSLSFL